MSTQLMDLPGLPELQSSSTRAAARRSPEATVSESSWIALALHPATLRRALITACIVGVALIAINHGAAIVTGTVTRGRILQMCLTVVVPYLVSTTASVATRRELARNAPAKAS